MRMTTFIKANDDDILC